MINYTCIRLLPSPDLCFRMGWSQDHEVRTREWRKWYVSTPRRDGRKQYEYDKKTKGGAKGDIRIRYTEDGQRQVIGEEHGEETSGRMIHQSSSSSFSSPSPLPALFFPWNQTGWAGGWLSPLGKTHFICAFFFFCSCFVLGCLLDIRLQRAVKIHTEGDEMKVPSSPHHQAPSTLHRATYLPHLTDGTLTCHIDSWMTDTDRNQHRGFQSWSSRASPDWRTYMRRAHVWVL